MPAYAGAGQAKLLRNNSQAFFWNNEVIGVGGLSQAFLLERINRSDYTWGLSVEAWFAGAPGTFSLYIMGANNDNPNNYVELGTITTVNSANVGRWDMPSNLWPKYVAGYVSALANAVAVTMQVTK